MWSYWHTDIPLLLPTTRLHRTYLDSTHFLPRLFTFLLSLWFLPLFLLLLLILFLSLSIHSQSFFFFPSLIPRVYYCGSTGPNLVGLRPFLQYFFWLQYYLFLLWLLSKHTLFQIFQVSIQYRILCILLYPTICSLPLPLHARCRSLRCIHVLAHSICTVFCFLLLVWFFSFLLLSLFPSCSCCIHAFVAILCCCPVSILYCTFLIPFQCPWLFLFFHVYCYSPFSISYSSPILLLSLFYSFSFSLSFFPFFPCCCLSSISTVLQPFGLVIWSILLVLDFYLRFSSSPLPYSSYPTFNLNPYL